MINIPEQVTNTPSLPQPFVNLSREINIKDISFDSEKEIITLTSEQDCKGDITNFNIPSNKLDLILKHIRLFYDNKIAREMYGRNP